MTLLFTITAVAWEVAEESGRDTFLIASVLDSQLTCSSYFDLAAANSGAACYWKANRTPVKWHKAF